MCSLENTGESKLGTPNSTKMLRCLIRQWGSRVRLHSPGSVSARVNTSANSANVHRLPSLLMPKNLADCEPGRFVAD
ncbi:MAG: hypothetical protein [Olavius algarvensis spirochete endosymbiont]|nr:MAG: hypothetical protein [Olavius algarvensis spirochete endosymbiont]